MLPAGFRERAHPADLCLEVWGASRAALYEQAALGLFHALDFGPTPTAAPVSCDIALEAPDAETLMVDWLSELLYQSERQRARWCVFELRQVSATALQATAHGERPGTPRREVKAVTYAGLTIAQDEQGQWSAAITFDV